MNHLTPEQLSALHDGAMPARAADEASRHLASCAECRGALEEIVSGDAALATALEHDPGDAFFERLADRIDARIADESAAVAPAKAPVSGGLGGVWAWLMSPRGLAVAGAAAVVVVGAAIVLVTARQTPLRDLRNPKLVARSNQVESSRPPASAAGGAQDDAAQSEEEASRVGVASPAGPNPSAALRQEATLDEAVPQLKSAPAPTPAPSALESAPPADRDAAPRRDRRFAAAPAPELKSRAKVATPALLAKPAPTPTRIPMNAPEAAKSAADRVTESREAAPPAVAQASEAMMQKETSVAKREAQPLARGSSAGAESAAPTTTSERAGFEAPQQGATPPAARSLIGSDAALGKLTRDLLGRAATARLCGVVRDATGRAIAGAQVALSDLGRAVRTSADGRFCIDSPSGDHTVTVMAVGYETQRRAIHIEGSAGEAEFTLRTVEVLRGGRASETRFQFQMPDTSFAAWPEALREPARHAQQRVDLGLREHSAGRIDQGAAGWEQVLDRARGGDFEVAARERLGVARYLAWEMAPTPARAEAAIETLTSYLTRAPLGPARDHAAQRLDRVRR